MGYNDTTLYPFEKLEIYDINIFQDKIGKYLKDLCGKESDYGYNYNGWATGYKTSKIDENIENDAIKTITRHTPKSNKYIVDRVIAIYNKNVNVTIRKEFGSKVDAACGQLRSKKEELWDHFI